MGSWGGSCCERFAGFSALSLFVLPSRAFRAPSFKAGCGCLDARALAHPPLVIVHTVGRYSVGLASVFWVAACCEMRLPRRWGILIGFPPIVFFAPGVFAVALGPQGLAVRLAVVRSLVWKAHRRSGDGGGSAGRFGRWQCGRGAARVATACHAAAAVQLPP